MQYVVSERSKLISENYEVMFRIEKLIAEIKKLDAAQRQLIRLHIELMQRLEDEAEYMRWMPED